MVQYKGTIWLPYGDLFVIRFFWRKVKKLWRKAWEFVMEIVRKHAYTFYI